MENYGHNGCKECLYLYNDASEVPCCYCKGTAHPARKNITNVKTTGRLPRRLTKTAANQSPTKTAPSTIPRITLRATSTAPSAETEASARPVADRGTGNEHSC